MKDRTKEPVPAALRNFDTLPDSAFVRVGVVGDLFGISIATAWRWAKAGRLPAPIRLGPGTTGWNVGELRRALSQNAA